MKTTILSLLLLPLLQTVAAQKIKEKKYDPLDSFYMATLDLDALNGKPLINKSLTVGASSYYSAKTKHQGSDTAIVLSFMFRGGSVFSLKDDSEIIFQFTDESVITKKHGGGYKIYSGTDVANLMFQLLIPSEANDKLTYMPIKKVRIKGSNGSWDFDVDTKKANYIIDAIALLRSQQF